MIPLTRNEADLALADAIRIAATAGRSPSEMILAADELVASWPAAIRPDPGSINKMLTFYGLKVLPLDPVPPRPVKGRAVDEDVPDGSEAALAEWLAKTDLCHRLRWSVAADGGGWHEWNCTHWQATADRAPLALQAAVRRGLAAGIEGRAFDVKLAPRLESAAAIRGVGSLLAAWPTMRLPSENDPPGLIACPRGVLDLTIGEWLAHDPARAITRCCPVDPGPTCPAWQLIEGHLTTCLGSLYPAVHRFIGSSLMGRGADRRMLWLTGPGGDGKSTLAKILRLCLGPHASVIPSEAFADGGARGAHGHELAAGMAGARLAVALEVSPRLNWDRVKSLSGGDEQRTKRTHGRAFTYERPPCLILISNDRPSPPDKASAERIILAEMRPPNDHDEALMATLKTPGPARDEIAAACLSWLIRGCADFLTHGLGPVPLMAFSPAGLDRWWADGVAVGRLVPEGSRWSSLGEIRDDLTAAGLNESLSDQELASFLKTVVDFKRTNTGRLYRVGLAVTLSDGLKPSFSHVCKEQF